jgi:IclR family transcriptional regulator, pca regulon regulatory protein
MTVSNRSLSRGLAIVRVFNQIPTPSLTEIACTVGLTKATCLRYLGTLQEEGYLALDDKSKRYQLRPLVLELGYAALTSLSLPFIAEPEMETLANEIGGSVHLGVLDGDEVVVVARAVAAPEIRKLVTMNIHVGSRLPSYCTAMGRILISRQVENVGGFISSLDLRKHTSKTLTHQAQLVSEINESGKRGWSTVEEDLGIGYSAIAVAIGAGNQLFALAASVATKDYSRASLVRELLPLLQDTASRLQGAFIAVR